VQLDQARRRLVVANLVSCAKFELKECAAARSSRPADVCRQIRKVFTSEQLKGLRG
jgi:hypothetical protein